MRSSVEKRLAAPAVSFARNKESSLLARQALAEGPSGTKAGWSLQIGMQSNGRTPLSGRGKCWFDSSHPDLPSTLPIHSPFLARRRAEGRST